MDIICLQIIERQRHQADEECGFCEEINPRYLAAIAKRPNSRGRKDGRKTAIHETRNR